MRIRDSKFESGIRDKYLGSATLVGMDQQLLFNRLTVLTTIL
jgi:hypothetical protein